MQWADPAFSETRRMWVLQGQESGESRQLLLQFREQREGLEGDPDLRYCHPMKREQHADEVGRHDQWGLSL